MTACAHGIASFASFASLQIKHTLNARAALTLGKDMVFRDLAQGAYRMRGIAKGQTISMLVIPEVQQLMKRQLSKAATLDARTAQASQSQLLQDVTAWLTLNSMSKLPARYP